jgi:hypothetical protein
MLTLYSRPDDWVELMEIYKNLVLVKIKKKTREN